MIVKKRCRTTNSLLIITSDLQQWSEVVLLSFSFEQWTPQYICLSFRVVFTVRSRIMEPIVFVIAIVRMMLNFFHIYRDIVYLVLVGVGRIKLKICVSCFFIIRSLYVVWGADWRLKYALTIIGVLRWGKISIICWNRMHANSFDTEVEAVPWRIFQFLV